MADNYLRAFAAAAGMGTVDNEYYRYDVPVVKNEAEVQRIVSEFRQEMDRFQQQEADRLRESSAIES